MVKFQSLATIAAIVPVLGLSESIPAAGGDLDYEALCPLAPEIVVVQDSSNSLKTVGQKIAETLGGALSEWRGSFPGEVKLGRVQFSDKPIALRGIGYQNAFKVHKATTDLCYEFSLGLTTNDNAIEDAFGTITWRNGGDLPECQYEALLYAAIDERIGWTPKEVQFDSEGRKITRIAIIVTDDRSHLSGDGVEGIMRYNRPFQTSSSGGWGSASFINQEAHPIVTKDNDQYLTAKNYGDLAKQLAQKYYIGYNYDQDFIDLYSDVFGPAQYTKVVKIHPGTIEGNAENGTLYDYPSLQQVKLGLKQNGVTPIILVTAPASGPHKSVHTKCIAEFGFKGDSQGYVSQADKVPCLVKYYEAELAEAGITGFVEGFASAEDVTETMMNAVLKVADFSCRPTTTTEEAVIPPEDDVSGSDDDSESEEGAFIVAGGGGMNPGVIAGAAAGAVAGVAIIGGLLWKKFGGGFMGKGGVEVAAVEQVESPDSPLERETLEQVTVDMFK